MRARDLLGRVLPAVLMSLSVALLAAGLLSYVTPASGVPGGEPSGTLGAVATPRGGEASPAAGLTLTPERTSPPPSPAGPPSRSPGASAAPSSSPSSPSPSPSGPPAVATRVVIPSLRIDLPVVAGSLSVPGNRDDYPLCDVAQYLEVFGQPGGEGTVYLYAHAREGMLLPLLEASQRRDGRQLVGALVQVYTDDSRMHLYEIVVVKRHATDLSLAFDVPPGEHRLVLQTSEGPRGTVPKLQVAARPLSVSDADPAEAHPEPRPRACYDG